MGTILPFMRGDAVFGPQDIALMAMALDDVCKELNLAMGDAARELVALRIIELAARGERSPTRLRDRVLMERMPSRRLSPLRDVARD
jgi:hypothetical protein